MGLLKYSHIFGGWGWEADGTLWSAALIPKYPQWWGWASLSPGSLGARSRSPGGCLGLEGLSNHLLLPRTWCQKQGIKLRFSDMKHDHLNRNLNAWAKCLAWKKGLLESSCQAPPGSEWAWVKGRVTLFNTPCHSCSRAFMHSRFL